jgi:RNA polymerase sigma factor (sigma-70 family)
MEGELNVAGGVKAVGSISTGRERSRLGPGDDAARKRAAVETYARHQSVLRRTARRYSLCADDAEDALQRSLEILLRKAPTDDPRELIKWTQTVVKHEALAVRREREQILAGPAALPPEPEAEDWVALLPTTSAGPAERAERRESIARSREALRALKPHELRALTLLAEGYSYVEIGEITGFSHTKINRSLAEGRERFRKLIAGSEDGSRCTAMKPLLSAFCDGEAKPKEVAELREHLRACAHCRATLRAYRAVPGTVAALTPVLALDRSLLERIQDAFTDFVGGAGAATTKKVAVLCVATAGSAACVATGVVPTPFGGERDPAPRVEQVRTEAPAAEAPKPEVKPAPKLEPESRRKPEPVPQSVPEEAEPVSEPAPEYAPPPAPEPVAEPAPEPAPVASSGSGSPAGEFGP